MDAFVSQPVPLEAAVNNPLVFPSAAPLALAPVIIQKIMWLAGHGENGVQVRTLFPPLQAGEVMRD